jgi:hypothetical protein
MPSQSISFGAVPITIRFTTPFADSFEVSASPRATVSTAAMKSAESGGATEPTNKSNNGAARRIGTRALAAIEGLFAYRSAGAATATRRKGPSASATLCSENR